MSLKNLIALQNKKKDGLKNDTAGSNPTGAGAAETAQGGSAGDHDSVRADAVPQSAAPAPEAAKEKPRGLGLNVARVGAANSRPNPPAAPSRVQRAGTDLGNNSSADSSDDDGAVFGLADLAGFEAGPDSAPEKRIVGERFDDEVDATAPDRLLDPEMTQQQKLFIESLDNIYPVLHDPEMFGQAVRIIMLELQDNPEYKRLICDEDVHTMIRGMRNTMGLARIRKTEKSRKTGAKGKTSARGKSSVSDDDMALLDSIMGGGGDD